MSTDRPAQSWPTAVVDLAILGVLALFAIKNIKEAAAWTLLGGIVTGRFGVSFGKQLERVTTGRQGPPSGPGERPAGTGTSGQYRFDLPGSSVPPGAKRLGLIFTPEVMQRAAVVVVTAIVAAVVVTG
jgi:hypothetical protein